MERVAKARDHYTGANSRRIVASEIADDLTARFDRDKGYMDIVDTHFFSKQHRKLTEKQSIATGEEEQALRAYESRIRQLGKAKSAFRTRTGRLLRKATNPRFFSKRGKKIWDAANLGAAVDKATLGNITRETEERKARRKRK
ncbi:MAG: hypothetical protein V1776_01260 [Candidatus Diapherotrites archaeon]